MSVVSSVCCYCGTGCGVLIEADAGKITGVRGDPAHPANRGKLCTKGATLHLSARASGRALYPELRASKGLPRQRVSWDVALDHAAEKFHGVIREHGPDAVAFYISGQLTTEAYYVFNKLAKGLIGTNNVDTNSRLCMSSAVAGYKQTLGADAPPCCYEDILQAKVIFIAGANPAVAHPIVFRYIEDAKAANPELKIIVADPRFSESAEIADLHLALKPGSDIALFNSMLHVLIDEGLVDRSYVEAHTTGFSALAEIAKAYPPAMVAGICGIAEQDIVQAARWFGRSGAALSLYCQGLNQSAHGTHNNAGIIHLHLATGQIGKPGAGPFSLTGQPNAMGGREVGGLSNLMSAHRDLANPEHRAEMAQFWGVPFVPSKPGKSAVDLFKSLKTGEIKAVWIACTNPAQSLPDQNLVHEALQVAECVVLQEAFADTETVAYADVLATTVTPAVEQAIATLDPDAHSLYMLTSGSTSMPKAVVQTQRMVTANVAQARQVLAQTAGWTETMLDWLPWSHVSGACNQFATLCSGGRFYIDAGRPMPGLFEESLRNIKEIPPSFHINVPFGYAMLADALEQDADVQQMELGAETLGENPGELERPRGGLHFHDVERRDVGDARGRAHAGVHRKS